MASARNNSPAIARAGTKRKQWNRFKLFLYALPAIILVFMFHYLPLWGWSFAFFQYKPGKSHAQEPVPGADQHLRHPLPGLSVLAAAPFVRGVLKRDAQPQVPEVRPVGDHPAKLHRMGHHLFPGEQLLFHQRAGEQYPAGAGGDFGAL